MKLACIYGRYSSDAQKATSIEDQLRDNYEYAQREGYTVVRTYTDYAVSGMTSDRDAFQDMLADAQTGLFQYVIVWKTDRFGRNREEIILNKQKLRRCGVKVVSAMETIPDGPEGIIIESVLEGYAEYFVADLVKKMMRGKRGRALECKHTGGRPLLGYKVLPDKSYAIDETGADTVRLIFKMYAEGSSYNEIIDRCNREGRKTGAGKPFGKNSLHELLRNERYIGVYSFGGRAPGKYKDGKLVFNSHAPRDQKNMVRIEGGMPAIVDRDTWDTVQEILQKNKRHGGQHKAKVPYLLSGRLFCGECGSAMVGRLSGDNGSYSYYECSARKRQRVCKKRNLRRDDIESHVIKTTKNYVLHPEIISQIAELVAERANMHVQTNDTTKALKTAISDTDTKIENLMKAIMQGVVTPTTTGTLKELEDEKARLCAELEMERAAKNAIIREEDVLCWLYGIRAQIENSDVFTREMIRTFIQGVYSFDDGSVAIIYSFSHKKPKPITLIELTKVMGFGDSMVRIKSNHIYPQIKVLEGYFAVITKLSA